MNIRLTQAFALKILETSAVRPEAFEWSLQGFGMLRLYLSKAVRLHVWNPRFAVPNVTTIHTHPWHFRSTVIFGSMTDRLYNVDDYKGLSVMPNDDPPTHRRLRIVCGPGGGATKFSTSVRLEPLQEVTLGMGESYGATADAAHESKPTQHTVTVIEREFRVDTEHAFVFVPVGHTWVSAEPREATPGEVRKICGEAFDTWRHA